MLDINLIQGRSLAKMFIRNGGQDPLAYSDQQIDFAFQTCADRLIREGRIEPVLCSITLNASNSQLTGFPTNFRTDRVVNAYISSTNAQVNGSYLDPNFPFYSVGAPLWSDLSPTTVNLKIVSYPSILDNIQMYGAVGQPTMLGYDQRSGTGQCFPIPDQNYTASIMWIDLFTQWVPGSQGVYSSGSTYTLGDVVSSGTNGTFQSLTQGNINNTPHTATSAWVSLSTSSSYASVPANVTFNLPNDYLRQLFTVGIVSVVQGNDPMNGFAQSAKASFDQFLAEMRGKGNLGENSIMIAGRGLSMGGGSSWGW